MSVVSLEDVRHRYQTRAKSDEQHARSRVRDYLRGRCTPHRIAQAEARAERLVIAGLAISRAIERATAWALSATDSPPEAA